jgi:methionyl-tRNA synthetase
MQKKLITTPIYYVNAKPHIGHAYTTIAADVYKRSLKQGGEETYLLTGTDEHGAKIAAAALKNNEAPQELADSISKDFKQTWVDLDIQFDQFIRTTDPRHEDTVKEVLTNIKNKGDIYPGTYEGLYCVGCEEYKKETELINGLCPIHKTKPELVKEDVWFFKLSKYENQVKEIIENKKINIFPESRHNEVLSFISGGLEDIAISRSKVAWGINLPWDPKQTIYVWVEALFNYYSASKIDSQFNIFPPDTHFIGKDILRFHAIIWPALLMSADLTLPKNIAVHGFFTINGEKMSKSLGNVIAPQELIDLFGVDATRYLLLSQFPFGNDGDFSIDKLKETYNSQLVNGLGNLVQRVITVANKLEVKIEIKKIISGLEIKNFNFYENIRKIQQDIDLANKYVAQNKPWELAVASEEAKEVIEHLSAQINIIASNIEPFMPSISKEIIKQLESSKPEILFPRIIDG